MRSGDVAVTIHLLNQDASFRARVENGSSSGTKSTWEINNKAKRKNKMKQEGNRQKINK